MDPSLIKTIIVVMMENRSFDNLLGYRSLAPWSHQEVEGLGKVADWEDRYASAYKGNSYRPFLLDNPYDPIAADPPHERGPIALQMGKPVNGIFPMDGFVSNYANAKGAKEPVPGSAPPVMGYYTEEQAPVTHFLAEKFAICDHWFSALPAGTQPNRLMAMSGRTRIDVNRFPLPEQPLVYDWLTERKIPWRVYHEELPFFSMMPKWVPAIAKGENFRPFQKFFEDVSNTPPGDFPSVVFVEPAYTDAPHLGISSDDHAPSAIRGGQEFLLEVYRAATNDRDFWRGAVMVVTYDEHGGFFDHVSPPLVRTFPPQDALYTAAFETLGVRVPAFVISPFVRPGSVCSDRMDHTSILKMLGSKFGQGGSYSEEVDQRPVANLLEMLEVPTEPTDAPIIATIEDYLAKAAGPAGFIPGRGPTSVIQRAFQDALDRIRLHPVRPAGKLGMLLDTFPPRGS